MGRNKLRTEIDGIETTTKNIKNHYNRGGQSFSQINKKNDKKIQINKIRDEKGNITTDIKDIQRIIRIYF